MEMPPSIWPVLGFGIALTSMYYIAASLVLPNTSETIDFDAYYMNHRHAVLGITLACFLIVTLLISLEAGELRNIDTVAISYIVAVILTMLAPGKWANAAGLGCLLVIDVLTFVPQLVGV
jgi:hypothetical protein